MAERTEFVEDEVVIYEGHLEDRLMVVVRVFEMNHSHRPDNVVIRGIDGNHPRDTTTDRLRKATREALTNEILRLESSLATLRYAMRNQTFGDKSERRLHP